MRSIGHRVRPGLEIREGHDAAGYPGHRGPYESPRPNPRVQATMAIPRGAGPSLADGPDGSPDAVPNSERHWRDLRRPLKFSNLIVSVTRCGHVLIRVSMPPILNLRPAETFSYRDTANLGLPLAVGVRPLLQLATTSRY